MQAKLPGTSKLERPNKTRPPKIDDPEQYALPAKSDLPDVPGIVWGLFGTDGDTRYIKGDLVTSPAGVDTERPPNGELPANAVVEGVGEYIKTHGVKKVDYPEYYSRFSDFEPIINTWTTASTGIGMGLEQNLLRGLIRLSNGSGRINHSKTHVILCENGTVLVTGPRGAFIKDLWGIKAHTTDQEPPTDVYHDLKGFSIPEENNAVLEKTEALLNAIEEYTEYTVDNYEYSRERGKHLFFTECGLQFSPRGGLLLQAGDKDTVIGEHETEHRGTSYATTVTEDDIQHQIGETISSAGPNTKTVLGYTFDWKVREYIFSGGVPSVDAVLSYVVLTHAPPWNAEGNVYLDYGVTTRNQTLDAFKIDD